MRIRKMNDRLLAFSDDSNTKLCALATVTPNLVDGLRILS